MFLCKQNKKSNKQKQIKKKIQILKDKNSDMDIEDIFIGFSFLNF